MEGQSSTGGPQPQGTASPAGPPATPPTSPASGAGPGTAGPSAGAAGSGGTARRLWWLWLLIGVVVVFVIAFWIGRATGQESAPETTTTTAQAAVPPVHAPTIVITESQNGDTIEVGTGWVTLLQLTGNPDDGSVWDVNAINAKLMQVFPGPQISYVSYAPVPEATYTYSALALSEGDVQVQARNVTPTGKVNKTFSCTIRIVSASQLTTTTTVASSTTTETAATTTSASTTTTTVASTTTTAAPTTTSAAPSTTAPTTTTTKPPTTTTKPATTTTKPATTTTKPATTTTTKPSVTTTTLPPTTTTTYPVPPIEIPPDAVFLGPKANGNIEVVPTTASALILALPDTESGTSQWKLSSFDESVLKLRGEPEFVPLGPGSSAGARVWTFDVVGPGATDLEAQYADASGVVERYFFVSISVQELVPTPF